MLDLPTLRPYQDDLLDAIIEQYQRGYRRVLARADTGAGKTVVFSAITLRATLKRKRVTIAAHRVEIVDQISRALDSFGVRHGRIQSGHTMTGDPVQVAMIITLGKRLDQIAAPDLFVIDECHHATGGSYRVIADRWIKTRILGVTATPNRLDGRGLNDCFDVMVEAIPMADLIAQGFLAGYTYLAPPTRIDLSSVATRNGDYAVDQLAAATDKSVITGDAVGHAKMYLAGRPAIVFTVTVEHAEHVAAQFAEAGFRAASVDGSMSSKERRSRIEGIGNGNLDILTSCQLISEGTDIPAVGGAILLRPTKSLALHLQQVGRSLRPKSDGSNAVILDHVGNIRHGLPDAPRIWSLAAKKKKKHEDAPVAQCEVCYRVFGVYPNWKQKLRDHNEPCQEPTDPRCLLMSEGSSGGERELPEAEEGTLSVVSTSPEWAGGLNIATARGTEWYRLMDRADTLEKLAQVAKARGYHWKWARNVMAARARKAA